MLEYVKVLLYAYPKLPQISEAVSVGVENGALLSFRARGSALEAAEAVARDVLVRKNLDGAYCAIGEILDLLSEEERYFLEYKYFRRKKELQTYENRSVACSERNYFRLQNALVRKIGAMLTARGWSEHGYREAFGGFEPFCKLHRAILGGRERSVSAKRKKRGIAFCRSAGRDQSS